MSYTISLAKIVDYPPEMLRDFIRYGYEYIDIRQIALKPEAVLGSDEKALPYVEEAKRIFSEMDWQGDGDVELL
jgi:hypothetical protein